MKSIITLALLVFITNVAFAANREPAAVAKVDYSEIDDLLTEVVLNIEGNQELRERYNAKRKAAKDAQEKMQAAIMRGEGVNPGEAALGFMHDDADRKKVEQLCQKHLLEIIEQTFEGKYDIIFKDDYKSSLLFTKGPIDDITIIIRQNLLKSIPKN